MADFTPSSVWKNGKRMGNLTSPSSSHDANAGLVATDAGMLTRKGPSAGTITINYVITKTTTSEDTLLRHLLRGEEITLVEGPVGTDVIESKGIVTNVDRTSNKEDGSFTGSAQVMIKEDSKIK